MRLIEYIYFCCCCLAFRLFFVWRRSFLAKPFVSKDNFLFYFIFFVDFTIFWVKAMNNLCDEIHFHTAQCMGGLKRCPPAWYVNVPDSIGWSDALKWMTARLSIFDCDAICVLVKWEMKSVWVRESNAICIRKLSAIINKLLSSVILRCLIIQHHTRYTHNKAIYNMLSLSLSLCINILYYTILQWPVHSCDTGSHILSNWTFKM